ncbi:MAG: hypothetical protein E7637_04975 [Ruminococcaceae bacterium]|nr:hypothetical protein [Oscillospiraceae bacterium]
MKKQHTPLQKNRKRIGFFTLAALLAVCLTLLVNIAVGALPITVKQRNLAKINTYPLSGASRDWISDLDTDVELFLLCRGGELGMDRDLYGFLNGYAKASERITLRVVDIAANPKALDDYTQMLPSDNSVLVKSEKRYRILDNTELYFYDVPEIGRCTSEEYSLILEYLLAYDTTGKAAQSASENTTVYFDGDEVITNALQFVTLDRVPHVYVLSAHETDAPTAAMQTALFRKGFALDFITTLSTVPDDCDMLLINAPKEDLGEDEQAALSSYLSCGGKLFLTTSHQSVELPRLGEVLSAFGMRFTGGNSDYLAEGSSMQQIQGAKNNCFYATINSSHGATGSFFDDVVVISAHPILLDEVEGVTVTPWLYTSEDGILIEYDEETETSAENPTRAQYVFGAIAESKNTSIVWISCGDILSDALNAYSSNGGNYTLILSAIQYINRTAVHDIEGTPTAVTQNILAVSETQGTVFAAVAVLVLPLSVLTIGFAACRARKKRE